MAVGFSKLISRTQITTDSQTRTRGIDRFIVHHGGTELSNGRGIHAVA